MGEPHAVAVNSSSDDYSKDNPGGSVNLGRHQAQCSICKSRYREQIDELFVEWASPDKIIQSFSAVRRDSIYRHAHACGLFEKRKPNIGRALEKIIEKVDYVFPACAQVVSAIQAYAKLNNLAVAPKPTTRSNAMELPKQRPPAESENSGGGSSLPESNSQAEAATPDDSQTGGNESQGTGANRVQDFVADDGSGGNFTPAVTAEVSSGVPVVVAEVEPIEV